MANRNTKIKMSQIADIAPSDVTANATNTPSTGQVPSKAGSGDEWTWIDPGTSGGSGEYFEKSINQNSHGFIVGDVIRHNGTIFVKALGDSDANAEVIGIVSENTDTDNFKFRYGGYISGLSGLTAGSVYYLSDVTAGLLTSTEPATEGHISKPVLIATSTTTGYIFNFRGAEVEGIGGSATYSISFTNSDLSSGILTVTHNLSFDYPMVIVYDSNNMVIGPDDIEYINSNSVEVDLSSWGTISGTWHIRVIGGAWNNSYIQDSDGDTKIETERTTDIDKIYFKTGGTDRAVLDSTGLTLENGTNINEFSIDGTLAGDSDNAVPTEKAVKTYVDNSTTPPGGSDTQIQFNDGGSAFGGDSAFTWNKTNDTLTISSSANQTRLEIDNDGTAHGLYLHQDGALASGRYGLYVYSNAAIIGTSLCYMHMDNTSADGVLLYLDNDGGGQALFINHEGTGNAVCMYIANGGSGDSIQDDSGAKLTAAGVWTNATSTYADKENITNLTIEGFIDKLKTLKLFNYQKKREVYGAKVNGEYPVEVLNADAPYYKGYILDDESTPEELIARDLDGNINGVSAADGINFLLAVCKEQQNKIDEQESTISNQQTVIANLIARVEALEGQ